MRNSGIILLVLGLVLFFILGLPVWLVKLIGVIVAIGGLFMIIAPEKAEELFGKCRFKKESEVEKKD
ncbi:MAG: hypothetical protein KAW56_10040 [Candidatus Marinimicrobia bacterium]|nr:hypothetical protein [Candidatus Neomarinimicrobiota bacterium]